MRSKASDRNFISAQSNDTQYGFRIAYHLLYKAGFFWLSICLLAFGLSSCRGQPTPYLAPSNSAQVTPPILASVMPTPKSQLIATPFTFFAPACTNNLTFLEDITIPAGTVARPGESIDKRWLVLNSGSCSWDERYRLKFKSGSELNAPVEQELFPARSGTRATLRILFTAPTDPGTYQSTWQAYDPQGQPFGEPISIQIIVETGNS